MKKFEDKYKKPLFFEGWRLLPKGWDTVISNKMASNFLILLLLSFSQLAYSQQLTLLDLEKTALENNRSLRTSTLEIEQNQVRVGTFKDIPKASVELQYGNIQTPFVGDYTLSFIQNFENPKLYQARKKMLETYVKQAEVQLDLRKLEIKKQVRENYYQLIYYKLLNQFLVSQDSIYQQAVRKATLRYDTGETNVLEKIHFETQQKALQNRQQQARNQAKVPYFRLQNLLATSDSLLFSETEFSEKRLVNFSASELPFLQSFVAQQSTINEQIILEKRHLKPGFIGGVSNQSMNGSLRQFIVTGGLTFPIFKEAQNAKIEALAVDNKVINAKYLDTENQLLTEITTLRTELNTANNTIGYLEKSAMPQVSLLIKTATKQYNEGDINYLEFQLIYTQAIGIQETYLQEQLKLKLIETNIQFITGK